MAHNFLNCWILGEQFFDKLDKSCFLLRGSRILNHLAVGIMLIETADVADTDRASIMTTGVATGFGKGPTGFYFTVQMNEEVVAYVFGLAIADVG